MASVELATAYVSLVPTLKGAQGAIARELGSVDADGIGKGIGGRMGGGIAGALKGIVGPAMAAIAAVGFGSLISEAAAASDATDKFKSTMNFAGIDTSGIDAATKSAKAYADQTVYDLPTIQATMAQLASNGVSGYTELTEAAGNLNAVAGGNAETFKSVSRTLTQSAGAGKLMTEDWNMLADAIPGASGPLQDVMREAGAFEGNFKKAMENGEISSEEFQAALSKLGNDPIAVEAARSTSTFEGAIGNLQATINSGLMGALDALKPAITGAIGGLATGLGAIFTGFGAIYELFKTGDFNGGIGKALGLEEDSPVIGVILGIRDGVIAAFGGIRSALSGVDFAGIFGTLAAVVGPLIPQFLALFSSVSPIQTIFQAIQPLLPQLLDVFVQLATVVGQSLGQAMTALLPVFVQLQGVFVSVFQQVLATVLPVIVQLVTMLGETFAQLLPIIVPIITQVVTLAATLISQLAPIFMQLVSTVLPMVVTIFGAVLSAIGPLVSMLASILIPVIQALMPVVVTVFGVIADVIGSAMKIVMGIIEVVTGIISGNWAQVWSGILNIVSGVFGLIVDLISGAIQMFISIIGAGLNIVVSTFTGIFAGIVSYLATSWRSITDGAAGMLSDLLGFFGSIGGKIIGALGNIGGTLFNTGKNIIQGLIDGIGSMMGAIGRAVLSIVPEAIRGPFEDLLGIHSPSRVFRGYGVNIGQGLILGIGDMHSDIESAVNGMVTVPTSPSYGANTAAGDYRTTGGFGSTFNIYETDDPVATAHAVSRRQSALAV